MTALVPAFDFAQTTDEYIARVGLDAAEAAFEHDVQAGLTNSDSLAIVVGELTDNGWVEMGRDTFGPDGDEFFANIDPETGKLATTITYGHNSVDAFYLFERMLPEGPQRWTGAVIFEARVQTRDEDWMARRFVGAASGVQGHFDQATVYTALTRMGACWALRMQALHGKP